MDKLKQLAVIEQQPFRSPFPLVAQLRTAWNNVAARWLVQDMFRQQIAFNQAVAHVLTEQEERLVAQDRELTALARRIAQMSLAQAQDSS